MPQDSVTTERRRSAPVHHHAEAPPTSGPMGDRVAVIEGGDGRALVMSRGDDWFETLRDLAAPIEDRRSSMTTPRRCSMWRDDFLAWPTPGKAILIPGGPANLKCSEPDLPLVAREGPTGRSMTGDSRPERTVRCRRSCRSGSPPPTERLPISERVRSPKCSSTWPGPLASHGRALGEVAHR
jgi:hypothetical protein